MNIEDIKLGETYNVKVKVVGYEESYNGHTFIRTKALGEAYDFDILVSRSKHDPCRPFKEGDRVQARKIHGNLPQCRYNGNVGIKEGDIGTIARYNERNCYWVDFHKGMSWCIDAAYLELVTPVEELEPYSVQETMSHDGWQIVRDGLPLAIYDSRRHPNAKAAAEAECARLNEEWRKEQK